MSETDKGKLFWDGFQWVVRTNSLPTKDPTIMNQTRKMRKILLQNVPLYLGLTENDISEIVKNFLVSNYLNDPGNENPILSCQINSQNNTAQLETSSVQETNRLGKVETLKLFGHVCKIKKIGDYTPVSVAMANNAHFPLNKQTTAQAQAAALTAMKMISSKDTKVSGFSLTKPVSNFCGLPSKTLKVSNLIDPEKSQKLSEEDYDDILEDILGEFKQFGSIIDKFIVKPKCVKIGAEAGSVFIEYTDKEQAEKALNQITGRIFDGNEIRVVFVDEETFYTYFKKLHQQFSLSIQNAQTIYLKF